MTLQQLYYVVELSKHKSISAAAQALFIAQPSLSSAIKELEKEFHITILERSRHGITFTSEGLEFLNYAHYILEQATRMREHFHVANKEETLCLSISAQHYMFAVDALVSYIKRIPSGKAYDIQLQEVRTSQVIQDIVTRRSQIGILFISNMTRRFMERTLRKNELIFTPLFHSTPSIFIRHNHPLAKKNSVSIEDLEPYPYVHYIQGEDSYQFSEEIFLPDIHPKYKIGITDRSTCLNIIATTDAYTLGTGILFRYIRGRALTSIPLSNPLDTMEIGWIKLKATSLSPEALGFIRQLERALHTVHLAPLKKKAVLYKKR